MLFKTVYEEERWCYLRLSTLRKGVLFKIVYTEERGVI